MHVNRQHVTFPIFFFFIMFIQENNSVFCNQWSFVAQMTFSIHHFFNVIKNSYKSKYFFSFVSVYEGWGTAYIYMLFFWGGCYSSVEGTSHFTGLHWLQSFSCKQISRSYYHDYDGCIAFFDWACPHITTWTMISQFSTDYGSIQINHISHLSEP